MRHLFVRWLLAPTLLAVGCYVDGPPPQYAGEDNGSGDLVEVSPGVEVVADQGEPIFFADDYYWVNRGGIWYSSTWYGGGWYRAGRVPGPIVGIGHREAYVHYRPVGYVTHEPIHGGYVSHEQYHATHAPSGGVHVRAAVRGGRRR